MVVLGSFLGALDVVLVLFSAFQLIDSTHQPINPSTHRFNPSTHQLIGSTHQPINSSIQPINPSIEPINSRVLEFYILYSIVLLSSFDFLCLERAHECLGACPVVPGPPPWAPWGASLGGGPDPNSPGHFLASPLGFRIDFYIDFDVDF